MKTYNKILIPLLTGLLVVIFAGISTAQQGQLADLIQKARDAGIEESALVELQNRAGDRGINDQQLMEIIQPAVDMAEQNLPADFALKKALEGFSKGVPANKIGPVLERLKQTTGEAVQIIDPWMNKPEVQQMMNRPGESMSQNAFRTEMVSSASKAMMQNISSEMVGDILSQIGTESIISATNPPDIIAAIGILPDLSTMANDPQNSARLVVRALKGGFAANELQQLPSALNNARQRSELPAASVIEGVGKQLQGGVPAKEVLQNLFNGNVGGGPPGNTPKGLGNPQNRGNGNG